MNGHGYEPSSPSSRTIGTNATAHTPSQSGSDFDFGTPQSFNMGFMMSQGGAPHYRSAPTMLPQGYTSAGLAGMVVQQPAQAAIPSLPDARSLAMSETRGSNVVSGQGRTGNTTAQSYTRSPEGTRGSADGGEDTFTSNSQEGPGLQGDQSKHNMVESDVAPPWVDLKTKAGKDRKRLPLACIACRRKKIRCSGETPACKHCIRSRIPCVYKVTTRKAAPRTDYMAMLDKRLKRMEERVIKIIPKEEQGVVASTGRAVLKPPLPPSTPKTTAASKKRAAETAFGDELDEWAEVAVPSPDEAAEVQSKAGLEKEPLKRHVSDEHTLLHEGADRLPFKAIQEHLSEVFFDYVYGQSYPLLHKPSFMRKLSQDQVPPVLMLAVCAISARFSNHPEIRTEPAFLRGESWASAAREIALKRYDTPNITILIVYLILGLHEFGTCQGGRSWMFGGMAQRMAYALQLHKDLDYDPKSRRTDEKNDLTFTDREIRRRTMWSCFLMDRFNSSGTDRPIFVGTQYIRAQLPISDRYFNMEVVGPTECLDGTIPNPVPPDTGQMSDAKENMGVSAYLIRLVDLWGKLVNYLNHGDKEADQLPMWAEQSTFGALRRAAATWKDTLPESLRYTHENLLSHASEKTANQFLFLHIVHNQIILFTNRFAIPSPGSKPSFPPEMPSAFLSEAKHAALDAANQVSTLINEAMDYNVVAPFAGYCAFFSSTVHIYGAFSNNAALEASSKQNLAYNVKYLTKMRKYWGMFHFVTENLRDLYKRHAEAARLGEQAGAKEKDQGIFQYGDWFDRYPHGVSGTDYEEPKAETKKDPGADAVLGQKSDLQTVEEFFSKMTPPIRTAQQSAQRPNAVRKKRAKSSSKSTPASGRQQQSHHEDVKSLPRSQPVAEQDSIPSGSYEGMPDFHHSVDDITTSFDQPPNSLFVTQQSQQPLIPPQDRQMLLNPFSTPTNPILDPTSISAMNSTAPPDLENFDFSELGLNGNAGMGNFWGESSDAWYLPFNMEPPVVGGGDDWNLFSGSRDWSNWGGGWVDLPDPTMGATGLTPIPDVDVDTRQGVSRRGEGGGGGSLDGMGRFQ